MSKRTISKRTRVKPFLKVVNVAHVMPTRFTMNVDLRGVVNASSLAPQKRSVFALTAAACACIWRWGCSHVHGRLRARKQVRKQFEDLHRAGKSQWFFSKLRF